MASVVADSGSIYSTYISTIDHLPCDIVRSLWLVQSCNVAAQKETDTLHQMLQGKTAQTLLPHHGKRYHDAKNKTQRLMEEAKAEMESLCDQLVAHGQLVSQQIAHFQNLADVPEKQDSLRAEKLRAQLVHHYRENPLVSQVEALQEQERVLKDQGRVVITKTPGKLTGLKIVFKLGGKGDEAQPGESVKSKRVARKTKERTRSGGVGKKSEMKHTQSGRDKAQARGRRGPRESRSSHMELPAVPKPEQIFLEEVVEPQVKQEPEKFCFCKQPSSGDMIACDNEKCPNGEWFHYKCVGLLSRVEALKYAKQKWFCSTSCREKVELRPKRRKRKSGW